MTPGTAYTRHRFCVRFDAFRATHPGSDLLAIVQAFLRSLPVSQQSTARTALKRHLGRTALDWGGLEVARYRRNDANLMASVLRGDHRARVRAACADAKELAVIECLWTLRRAEVAALRWRDVDLGQGTVMVLKGKGDKPSWTLLTADAQAAIAAWFTAAGTPPDATPVFTVEAAGHPRFKGQPYTPNGLGKLVRRILLRAGLWTPGAGSAHRFRRSLATEYLRANPGDLVGLQKILRHEQVSTTARYAWLTQDDLTPRLARVVL